MTTERWPLIDFYLMKSPDIHGRMINQIWQWDEYKLEEVHNYIQWLFPLDEQSRFNNHAPVLDQTQINIIKSSDEIRNNLLKSLCIILKFYGLEINTSDDNTIIIDRGTNYELRRKKWQTSCNHNYLRITRILKCLMLTGFETYAFALFKLLTDVYVSEGKIQIDQISYLYWKRALCLN